MGGNGLSRPGGNSGFRVWELGFKVYGLGFRAQGLRLHGLGYTGGYMGET